MLDAARDDQEFAFLQIYRSVAKIHSKTPFDDQKQFVFGFVMMPMVVPLIHKIVPFQLIDVNFSSTENDPVKRKCQTRGRNQV